MLLPGESFDPDYHPSFQEIGLHPERSSYLRVWKFLNSSLPAPTLSCEIKSAVWLPDSKLPIKDEVGVHEVEIPVFAVSAAASVRKPRVKDLSLFVGRMPYEKFFVLARTNIELARLAAEQASTEVNSMTNAIIWLEKNVATDKLDITRAIA